jgi:hypothetical protein
MWQKTSPILKGIGAVAMVAGIFVTSVTVGWVVYGIGALAIGINAGYSYYASKHNYQDEDRWMVDAAVAVPSIAFGAAAQVASFVKPGFQALSALFGWATMPF